MSAVIKDYGIVVGVDGSPASDAAVSWAKNDAVTRHLPLTLVHGVDPFAATWPQTSVAGGFTLWRENEGRRVLGDALKIAQDSAEGSRPIPINAELIFSAVVPMLVDLSKRAELMVVGNHGRGALARDWLGSVSASLVRCAHCPVAVVPDEGPLAVDLHRAPVLLGIDGSPASELATALAFDEASRRRLDVMAVHAWSDAEISEFPGLDWAAVKTEEERSLAERLAGWQERYPDVTLHRLLVCDRPARVLVEKSQSAQLVVLGSHGRGRFIGALLGSVSNAVVQAVRVPVIVARPS
ncbi:MAG: universal stress protein [Mycobacterium sp.]|uniref:universal stress protein n=1 Tax=Mycobacterium sp. TaxID=1785 RepID=UPI003BB69565